MERKYFEENCKYKVVSSFSSGLHYFMQGDVLTYTSGGYSRYDDCFIYEFLDKNGIQKEMTLEDAYDNKSQNLFEHV